MLFEDGNKSLKAKNKTLPVAWEKFRVGKLVSFQLSAVTAETSLFKLGAENRKLTL